MSLCARLKVRCEQNNFDSVLLYRRKESGKLLARPSPSYGHSDTIYSLYIYASCIAAMMWG